MGMKESQREEKVKKKVKKKVLARASNSVVLKKKQMRNRSLFSCLFYFGLGFLDYGCLNESRIQLSDIHRLILVQSC